MLANWAGRLRSHALRGDLEKLGGCYRQTRIAPMEDEAAAFGALYVLEGSRLGGQVLARMVEASEDGGVRGATRYFRHGQGAGLWRSYLDALEASPGVRARPQRAARAARAAFAIFERFA